MNQAAPLQISNAKPKQSDGTALLLQRKCAYGSNASVLTGEYEECGEKSMLGLQTKLAISEPGDRYEQEADRIADAVVAGRPVGAIGGPPPGTAQRKCAQCEAASEVTLRRKEAAPPSTQHVRRHTADAAAIAVAHGGAPLTAEQRAYFEPRFGRNFSDVRIHTHELAATAAHRIDARAYTLGSNIAFAPGEFTPGNPEGRTLIAHELAHTLQQTDGSAPVIRRQKHTGPESVRDWKFWLQALGIALALSQRKIPPGIRDTSQEIERKKKEEAERKKKKGGSGNGGKGGGGKGGSAPPSPYRRGATPRMSGRLGHPLVELSGRIGWEIGRATATAAGEEEFYRGATERTFVSDEEFKRRMHESNPLPFLPDDWPTWFDW